MGLGFLDYVEERPGSNLELLYVQCDKEEIEKSIKSNERSRTIWTQAAVECRYPQ